MKRIILLFSITVFSLPLTHAQITNGGFENWTAAGNCDEPDDWGTLNGSTGILGICTAEQETVNFHGGTSAILLSTVFIGFPVNQIAPGIVTTGTINTTTEEVEGGHAFTERPTEFTGWYLADPEPGDNHSFAALLINENTGDTVGSAGWVGTTDVSSWTMFTAPVTYYLPDAPTQLQIILLPSDGFVPIAGSTVTFDDLEYETLTVGLDEPGTDMIRTYPNPVVENVFFNLGNSAEAIVSVFNILGEKVMEQKLTGAENRIHMGGLVNGTYVWQFSTTDGDLLKTGKLLLIR